MGVSVEAHGICCSQRGGTDAVAGNELFEDMVGFFIVFASGSIKHWIMKDNKLNADLDTVFMMGGVQ